MSLIVQILFLSVTTAIFFTNVSCDINTLNDNVTFDITCNGDENFLGILKRIKKDDPRFHRCMLNSRISDNKISSFLLATDEDMISVVKNQCNEFTYLFKCIEPLVDDYWKCLKAKDVEMDKFIVRFMKKMLVYVCADDGQKLTDLINHGVVSCLMSKFIFTKQCFTKLVTTVSNFENMVSVNIEKDVCSTLTDTQICIENVVKTCPDPELVNMVKDIFVHVETELTCESFV